MSLVVHVASDMGVQNYRGFRMLLSCCGGSVRLITLVKCHGRVVVDCLRLSLSKHLIIYLRPCVARRPEIPRGCSLAE